MKEPCQDHPDYVVLGCEACLYWLEDRYNVMQTALLKIKQYKTLANAEGEIAELVDKALKE